MTKLCKMYYTENMSIVFYVFAFFASLLLPFSTVETTGTTGSANTIIESTGPGLGNTTQSADWKLYDDGRINIECTLYKRTSGSGNPEYIKKASIKIDRGLLQDAKQISKDDVLYIKNSTGPTDEPIKDYQLGNKKFSPNPQQDRVLNELSSQTYSKCSALQNP